ncbi:hypothetical protein NQ315_015302 [Exocentrus adspersus]|uniref:Tc1-like transposase DDE domain-containing protein n=1 Tax=Exocentrus adspersus TaxID=1586481 RepID=A0AAV8V6N5_9CUCU|nr:hypothetical protein NQ315_015302 [Exocentrus adspersus]
MAKKDDEIVLRLPPYHCELNPIEMIWAQITNVKPLLIDALNKITEVNWKKCVDHVIKEEEKMSKLDGIMDDVIEPLIISINNDSDSDNDSSSGDSEDNI